MSEAGGAKWGAGPRHKGSGHFLWQRLTALALVVLGPWFVIALALASPADYAETRAFIAQPSIAIVTILFLGAACLHMQLGVQVVIEDYLQKPFGKNALLTANLLAALAAFAVGAFAVYRIGFGA